MAYNKTSEERKWNYWKEQEEKKLRELGMEEEKIQKLRQMDREDFLEEKLLRLWEWQNRRFIPKETV